MGNSTQRLKVCEDRSVSLYCTILPTLDSKQAKIGCRDIETGREEL